MKIPPIFSSPKRLRFSVFLAFLILLSVLFLPFFFFSSKEGSERIARLPPGETGAFYFSGSKPAPSAASQKETVQAAFDEFADRIFKEELSAASTLDLHYIVTDPESCGIETGPPTLGTFRLTNLIQGNAEAKAVKAQLEEFDVSSLAFDQQVLYDTLMETLDAALMAEGLELYEQPLSPTIGVQAQLPILLAEYEFNCKADIENYLALLEQLDQYYGQLLEFEFQKADAGLGLSDEGIDAIAASCEGYLIPPEENFLTESFDARLETFSGGQSAKDNADSLTDEETAAYRARHILAIQEHFVPAYELLIDGLLSLKGRGIQDGGLAGYQNGKQYYEYLVRSGPGLSYSIPELKKALARRMEEDLQTMKQLYETDPNFDGSGSFTLTEPVAILEDLKKQMEESFPEIPDTEKSAVDYEIRYVPEYLESVLSPAFYLTSPIDAPSRNTIYINNGYSDSTEDLYTTLAHEGFPGHLYQTAYHRVHSVHPLASLLSCSGANEGWATYVENLACLFDNGLSSEAGTYRACLRSFSLCAYSLLDIGVHYDGWTKEQAARFIRTWFEAGDSAVDSLWQTIVSSPANYLEYAGGYVEIMEMRAEAEAALGPRFSEKDFHTFLLDLGPVPFSVTRKYFSMWLGAQG